MKVTLFATPAGRGAPGERRAPGGGLARRGTRCSPCSIPTRRGLRAPRRRRGARVERLAVRGASDLGALFRLRRAIAGFRPTSHIFISPLQRVPAVLAAARTVGASA